MSITPIEMYTMAPKSQEASQVRHGEQAKFHSQQAEVVNKIDRNIQENSQRTTKAKESENPEYRYDAKDGGNGAGSYNPSGKGKQEEKDTDENNKFKGIVNTSRREGGIDIRI